MKWTNFVKYINKLNRGKNEIIQISIRNNRHLPNAKGQAWNWEACD